MYNPVSPFSRHDPSFSKTTTCAGTSIEANLADSLFQESKSTVIAVAPCKSMAHSSLRVTPFKWAVNPVLPAFALVQYNSVHDFLSCWIWVTRLFFELLLYYRCNFKLINELNDKSANLALKHRENRMFRLITEMLFDKSLYLMRTQELDIDLIAKSSVSSCVVME